MNETNEDFCPVCNEEITDDDLCATAIVGGEIVIIHDECKYELSSVQSESDLDLTHKVKSEMQKRKIH